MLLGLVERAAASVAFAAFWLDMRKIEGLTFFARG